MSVRMRAIAERRRMLVARAEVERGALAAQAARLRGSLAFADVAVRGYRLARSHPLALAMTAAALAAAGPGKWLRQCYRVGLIVLDVLRLVKSFKHPRS